MRLRTSCLTLATLLAASSLAFAAPAADVYEACYGSPAGELPGIEARACRSVEQVINGLGRTCRATVGDPATCANLDGRTIDPALVDEYENTWVPRALALQRGLDDGLPLQEELWTHTHNSYNSEAYPPTFSGLDPNQLYSIGEQLRMGIRAIELDLHWAPSLDGLPDDGGKAPIVCHGQAPAVGPVVVHAGCSTEVHMRVRLAEVADWLDANPNDVLMIYLENHLDDDPLAHQRASEALEETLGGLVYRPTSTGCQALPMDTSRAQIHATGARVILTGNCGPGAWTSWVFERGPRWDEGSSPEGVDYPDYPACVAAERIPRNYAQNWIRTWHDATWLGAMTDGGRVTAEIPAEEAVRMVRCGVNMIGFDNLQPFDPRLEALVWSWAPDEPSANAAGLCAATNAGGRFRAEDCGTQAHEFACVSPLGVWSVQGPAGSWSDGPAACAAAGATFAVPRTGYENELLKTVADGATVWLAYHSTGNAWLPQ